MTDDGDIIWRDLPCELTDKDWKRLANEQSANSLKAVELKDKASALSAEKSALLKDNVRLGHIVKAREETRQVKCKWVESLPENVTRLIRQDTGDEVESRTLRADELQGGLGFGDDPNNKQGTDSDDEADGPTTEAQDVNGADGDDDDPSDAPTDDATGAPVEVH